MEEPEPSRPAADRGGGGDPGGAVSTLGRPLPGNRGTEVDDWSVQALRRRIDLLDSRILKLLEERMELGCGRGG
jgi:hypothetical protein